MKGRRFEDCDYDAWLLKQAEENCSDGYDEEEVDEEYEAECRAEYMADAREAWYDKWGY